MMLIDSHCHLYLPEFDTDRSVMLERAMAKGISQFYLPGIDSHVIDAMLDMESRWPQHCFPMMGLHPCSVKPGYEQELDIITNWLAKRRFVAIGEIGLDFYWDTTHTQLQYQAFETQMELALQYDMPIVIHSRNAMQQCIDTVQPFAKRGLKGIFHCFGDSIDAARQIIDMGFLMGIGGVITYKKSGLAEVMKDIPLEHVVLETDAPYLSPVPYRGKRNESSYLVLVAEMIAAVKGFSVETVAHQTTMNAKQLFHPR